MPTFSHVLPDIVITLAILVAIGVFTTIGFLFAKKKKKDRESIGV